jgi:hypothetical protein
MSFILIYYTYIAFIVIYKLRNILVIKYNIKVIKHVLDLNDYYNIKLIWHFIK